MRKYLQRLLIFTWSWSIFFRSFFIIMNVKAIYKTRNTRAGNGMRGTRGMFTRISGNLLDDSGECYCFNIPGNVPEDSGECWRRFRGMFEDIPGNVQEDSGECSRRFRGMFKDIPGNVQEDSGKCLKKFRGMFQKITGNAQEDLGESKFRFILWNLAYFSQILQFNCVKTKEYFLRY